MDPESGRTCSDAFFKAGKMHSRSLLLPQPTIELSQKLIFCRKDRGCVQKKPLSKCISRPCFYAFSCFRLEKVQKEHGVAHVESKTKCVFQGWQNAFGSVWSSMSIGLSLLHYSMKTSEIKTNK